LSARTATVGVTEHGNSAVLVTVGSDGTLVDAAKSTSPTGCPRTRTTTILRGGAGAWATRR